MPLLLLVTDIPRLTLHQVAEQLGYKDTRSARKWCASHRVAVLRDAGMKSSYVIKSEFIAARLVSIDMYLKKRYGTQHYEQALSAYSAGDIAAIKDVTEATKKSSTTSKKISVPGAHASRFHSKISKIISGE